MTFWGIIKNAGTIISFFKTLREVAIEAANQKKFPDCQASYDLLIKTQALFDKKVIDLPGDKETEIAEMLAEVAGQLQCK